MKRTVLVAAALLPGFVLGCGPSAEEWQAQLDKYNHVVSDGAVKDRELAEARQRLAALEAELKRMGLETSKLNMSLADRERALSEYKGRAKQLEILKARFDLLRHKL